jgi:PAS domain-containing protein
VGVLGVGQDITERKAVAMEKARVAQELQTFIDTANAPIFGIDGLGLVNKWNKKLTSITGFSREEVLGKNLILVSPDAHFPNLFATFTDELLLNLGIYFARFSAESSNDF